MASKASYKLHQKIGQFVITKMADLEELQSTLVELEHIPTGAHVMHIANDDDENLFCLAFQTLPYNSNGVAHILEHTVLCGSKKYPIKDPFFAMTRRSLNTFMNALTGSDFTCFPASTQVEKDFYNLLEVYLDAVFNPLLNPLSFKQEGHRIEFEKPKDPSSPLVYKGIVYNEMKGAMASSDTRLWQSVIEYLTPDLPYAHNSGGEPKDIPSLTYEEFLTFYKTYYHPSRCLFFFYGNLPLEKHLSFIEKHTLAASEKLEQLPPIPKQKRFTKSKSFISSYPVQGKDLSNKTMIAFGWLTTPIENQQDLLSLQLLDSILMDTDASLLKYPILQSKLCRQADAFVDHEMTELPFVIVCKATEDKHADALEELIFNNLKDIAKKGIDSKLIASAIHQMELARTEINGEDTPFGLTLFFRSGLAKMHNCKAENALVIHEQFNKLLELTKDPTYLPKLIKKYLLDNPHFIRLIMKPDPTLNTKDAEEEKKRLEDIKAHLSHEDKLQIISDAEELKAFQKSIERQELECLPKLQLSDIPKATKDYKLNTESYKGKRLFMHDCFTNHLVYPSLVIDLPKLTEEEHLYARLFTSIVTELGSCKRSYQENLALMHAHTGGIGCSLSTHVQHLTPHALKPALYFRGKALSRHANHLLLLMRDFITHPDFSEKERVKELILQIYTHLQNRLNKGSLSYVVDLALSSFSYGGYLNNLWNGIPYFQFIEKIAKNIDEELLTVIEKLTMLKDKLFHFHNMDLVISCQKDDYQKLYDHHFYGLLDMKPKEFHAWSPPKASLDPLISHARVISAPVAFTAMSCKLDAAPHMHAPALSLASILLDNTVLHKKIREQGGAYGSGASYSTTTGNFFMYSYRDPHIKNTLDIFKGAPLDMAFPHLNERELEEAKFYMIQNLDSPVAPGSRGLVAYTQYRENKSLETRQAYRDALISMSLKDVSNAIEHQLSDFDKKAEIVTFCSKEQIEKENEKLSQRLPILPI